MSELSPNREFGPENQEADQASIELLENAIQQVVATHATRFDPSRGGSYSFDLQKFENDTLQVSYRPADSSSLLHDWCFKKEIPNATAHWLRLRGEQNESTDQLTLHTVVEEIWITQLEAGKQLRRRVYDPMYFNYSLDEKVDSQEYSRLAQLYEQRREHHLDQVELSDSEEEALGLNRVTNQQVFDYITLLRSATS